MSRIFHAVLGMGKAAGRFEVEDLAKHILLAKANCQGFRTGKSMLDINIHISNLHILRIYYIYFLLTIYYAFIFSFEAPGGVVSNAGPW